MMCAALAVSAVDVKAKPVKVDQTNVTPAPAAGSGCRC